MTIEKALWPAADLTHLLDSVARKSGLPHRGEPGIPPAEPQYLAAWVESACSSLGMETEPVEVWGHAVEGTLRLAAPALIPAAGLGWIGLLEIRGEFALLAAPDLATVRIPLPELVELLTR